MLRLGKEQISGQKSLEEAKKVPERFRVVILLVMGERVFKTAGVDAQVLLLNLIRSRFGRVKQALVAASRIDSRTYPELSHMTAS